jgi:hypothetical protein
MVTTKTIRCVGRRMLLAFLASAGTATYSALPAAAQSGAHMAARSGAVTSSDLGDIQLAPGEVIVNAPSMGGMPISNAIQHNGSNYQIVDASSVPMASGSMDASMSPVPDYSMHGGFPTAGYQGGCANGQCGSTGYGSGYGGDACGIPCNPYLYASLDALYIKNGNVDNYTRSTNFALNDFDYEFGVRGTIGLVPDCRNGMEVSFTGPLEWDTQRSVVSPGGGLNSLLTPTAPIVAGNLSTFNNSTFQSQRYEAEYFSFEASRTLIGWEICKFLYGLRYVNYDEDYFYRTAIANGDQGLLRSSTENQMIGFQVGIDMTYPMSCKVWSDFRGRAGAYANFAENTFELNNAGAAVIRNLDDDVELAGLFEIGTGLRYYLTDDFHVRAGTELTYIAGVATAIDQFNFRMRQDTGRRVNIEDDVLLFGLSVGAELKF